MFKKFLKWILFAGLSLGILTLLISYFPNISKVSALPGNFVKTKISEGFNSPTDFALIPDGRILILEKDGVIKVIKNGQVQPKSYINLPVNSDGERGLLGIALDPEFASNKFVYLYYVSADPLQIRVSRFTESEGQLSLGSEVILLKSVQTLGLLHHAGTIRFGPDGKLWISVGNNSISANSQDLSNIHGKLLRINKDGTIPSDNPFISYPTASKEIWAFGLRNPFRFSFLQDGKPIVGDVGDKSFEEVNIISKGGNYGYPHVEGACTQCPYINPVFYYPHGSDSASITGGFLYQDELFPEEYHHNYFFADYAKGFIKRLHMHEDGTLDHDEILDENAGTVVELLPDGQGNFYFLTIFPGALYKVSYSQGNIPPEARISADKTFGNLPLTINFSSQGSQDPENKPLSFEWDFGDGSTSEESNPTHTYNAKGKFIAKLTVSDGEVFSQPVSTQVFPGDLEPEINFSSPQDSAKYIAGDVINYSATSTDPEDGELPASAFSWTIIFHHGMHHMHPFLGPINGVKNGQFTIPDTGEPSAEVWYEVKLTVTDSVGLQKVISKEIYPNVVTLGIDSDPQGLQITLDGVPQTTPISFEAVVGFKRTLDVFTPQTKDGNSYDFNSWSDNGSKTHTVITPNIDTKYIAKFKSAGSGNGRVHLRIQEFDENNHWTGKFMNGATVKLTDISGNTVIGTAKSEIKQNEDGWVFFDNIPVGTYGVLAYKNGYEGIWKMGDCNGGGGFRNATIANINTEGGKAAFDDNVVITQNQIILCQDLGLKSATKGNLFIRVAEVLRVGTKFQTSGYINGVTVKLTDPTGHTVIKSATSSASPSNGEDGWVSFIGVDAGNYGILAYKAGFNGVTKMVDCLISDIPSTIENENTESLVAAWDEGIVITGGQSVTCHDLALTDPTKKASGSIRLRVQEFTHSNAWTGKFMNGATVKLTDSTGVTVFNIKTSDQIFGQDGWVFFDNIPVGTYGVLAYKNGYEGVWKQNGCKAVFDGVVLNNINTEGMKAAFDNNIPVSENQFTVCHDLGLKNVSAPTGSIRFRIQEYKGKIWTGNFLNGVIVKLTDPTGNTVIQTQISQIRDGLDGWVSFDNVLAGTYGIMAYKNGYEGVWKQNGECDGQGITKQATIKNENTEKLKAAFDDKVEIKTGELILCHDLGLMKNEGKIEIQSEDSSSFKIASPSATVILEGSPEPTASASLLQSPTPSVSPSTTSNPSPNVELNLPEIATQSGRIPKINLNNLLAFRTYQIRKVLTTFYGYAILL